MLVDEVLNGEIRSFYKLIRKYEVKIFKFVYCKIGDRQLAEDITQEVFINVYNKLNLYKNDFKFSSWLYSIARNRCVDYMRSKSKTKEASLDEAKNMQSNNMKPDEIYEFKETTNEVKEYIYTLDKLDREILTLRYWEELRFSEIAKILNISESRAKSRFYKCRRKFSEQRNTNNERRTNYEM